jgi:periplasmic divalent cation tolerance protein
MGKNRETEDCFQITTTLPTQSAAEELGSRLVLEHLVACAQVWGPISSTYRWQGKVEQSTEWFCELKTTRARLPAVRSRIRELHPYELPEIVALPIVDGDRGYLSWIVESVRDGDQ